MKDDFILFNIIHSFIPLMSLENTLINFMTLFFLLTKGSVQIYCYCNNYIIKLLNTNCMHTNLTN